MRLPVPFVKLPYTFDHHKLAEEISQFGEDEWRAHPQGFKGNSSLVLVSTDGEENDYYQGPMMPTGRLEKAPYIRQVMASFDTVIGRSRLMRLAPGSSVLEHTDVNYFWRNHLRIHVPIITDPAVAFNCDKEQVHMGQGESWTFDNWRMHSVDNGSDIIRIHLVIDTVGSAKLWRMIEGRDRDSKRVEFDPAYEPALTFEDFRGLPVIPPAELRIDLETLVEDMEAAGDPDDSVRDQVRNFTADFLRDWQSAWTTYGIGKKGLPAYKSLLESFRASLEHIPGQPILKSNGYSFKQAVLYTLEAAINPANFVNETADRPGFVPASRRGPKLDRPVFIVAAPRSGSTLLFETLALNREFWSVGDESHGHFERIAPLRPNPKNFSNRLTADMATPDIVETLTRYFQADLVNSDGHSFDHMASQSRPEMIRFLEKTPKNSLRIPFLLEAFPDARFIFLFRDAKQNISSLLDSWRSKKYVTYPDLPMWPKDWPWSHLLIPGWQKLAGATLAEITATQWAVTNQVIMGDLSKLPPERWCAIEYDSFLTSPMAELKRLCDFSQVVFGPRMKEVASKPFRISKHTLTMPHPDKWKKNAADLRAVIPSTDDLMSTLRSLV